jgi:hypothetical protein
MILAVTLFVHSREKSAVLGVQLSPSVAGNVTGPSYERLRLPCGSGDFYRGSSDGYEGESFNVSLTTWFKNQAKGTVGSCRLMARFIGDSDRYRLVGPTAFIKVPWRQGGVMSWQLRGAEQGTDSGIVEFYKEGAPEIAVGSISIHVNVQSSRRQVRGSDWLSELLQDLQVKVGVLDGESNLPGAPVAEAGNGTRTGDGFEVRVGATRAVGLEVRGLAGRLPPGLDPIVELKSCIEVAGENRAESSCKTTSISLGRPISVDQFVFFEPSAPGTVEVAVELSLAGRVDGELLPESTERFSEAVGRATFTAADRIAGSSSWGLQALSALGGVAGVALLVGGIIAFWRRNVQRGRQRDTPKSSSSTQGTESRSDAPPPHLSQ